MRNVLLSAVVMSLFSPVAAFAQEGSLKAAKELRDQKPPTTDEETPREGSATVAPSGTMETPSTQHTVERGDTLWDLSQKYLGSPWYWPKVWSYNPEIANPHWIFPGNVVRFAGGGEEAPTQVEVGAPAEEGVSDEVAFIPDDEDRVTSTGQIGYVPRKAIVLQATGFVTPKEVEESGSITGSFAESSLLSFPQTAYIELKNKRMPKVGETFIVFRAGGEVIHPVTRAVVGYLTKIVGAVRVIKVDKSGIATVDIEKEFHDMRRGDLLGPMGESMTHAVAARPNDRDIKDAFVVSSTTTDQTQFGEHHIVVIDKGSEDGVKQGNIFVMWRQHDADPQEIVLNPTLRDERWPKEDVGACMAYEVRTRATTCLVTKSIRELVRGDRAEMRQTHKMTSAR